MDELEQPQQTALAPIDDAAGALEATDDGFAVPAPPDYESEPNIVAKVPDWFRRQLAARVIADARADQASMKDFEEEIAKHYQLYRGKAPDRVPGQDNIEPIHLPLVRKGVKIFKAKAFPQLYPPKGDIVAFDVSNNDPELELSSLKVARLMNDKLRHDPGWLPSHDRGMTQELVGGVIFEIWYYDPIEEKESNEICLTGDVWIPYKHKSDRVDLADVPRITWRKRYYRHELRQLERKGYYSGITAPLGDSQPIYAEAQFSEDSQQIAQSYEPRPERGTVKEANDSDRGFEPGATDSDAPREFFEQDRWVQLPGEDFDRHVTVCVDVQNQTIHRLSLVEKVDPKDLQRFNREKALTDAQNQSAMLAYQQALDEHGAMLEELSQPQIDPMTGVPMPAAAQQMPPEPEPPAPLPEPAPPRKVPFHRWTIYRCDVDPEGMLGDGIPHDSAGHNRTANKVATRYVTALNVQLHPTIIMSRQSRFQRGDQAVELKVGKINESPLAPSLVQAGAGMFILQHPNPDPNAFRVIEQQSYESQALTSFDIALGAPGKSGQTATETEAQQSNATGNIELFAMRWNRARANSLKNLLYLMSLTMPEEGVDMVAPLKEGAPPEEFTVTRDDVERVLASAEVSFNIDPTMQPKAQKLRDKMKVFQTVQQLVQTPIMGDIPPIDPETAVSLYRAAASDVLKAMDRPDLAAQVEMAPMPNMASPTTPEGESPNGEMEGAPPDAGGGGGMEGPPSDGMVQGDAVA